MPYRTLTLQEVAHYLHLDSAEVERLVKEQDIPFERHGARLVFRKTEIDSWASPRVLCLEGRRLTDYHAKTTRNARENLFSPALLAQMLKPAFIEPALKAKTKASVIRQMVKLAEKTGRVWDPGGLLNGLEAREEVSSTGLPGGLALLHTRQADADLFESSFLVLGRTIQQIPFGAPDGRPTDLFFLIACTDDRLHLHILARICLLAQKTELLAQLRLAQNAEEMHEALNSCEAELLKSAAGTHAAV
jgi:excisionase family DNA binding protein